MFGAWWAASTAPALLVALLALLATPCANATLADLEDAADAATDVVLEAALRKVLASMADPQQLRSHVKAAVEEAHPELLAGAADCDLALLRWLQAVATRELWALQMVDASSKLVTGVLYGNLADLGNFDECVTAAPGRAPGEPAAADGGDLSVGFSGRYALPWLDLQAAQHAQDGLASLRRTLGGLPVGLPKSSLAKGTEGVASAHDHRQVTDGNSTEYSTLLSLRMALCVPSTCEAPVLEAALGAALAYTDGPLERAGLRLRARLGDRDTTLAGRWRKMEPADWVVISICVALAMLVLLGTTVDLSLSTKATKAREKASPLLAFSAWTNGRRLLTIAPPSESNFTCINGIRFLSALWVILGHRYRFALDVPFTNLITIPKRVSDVSVMVIASAPLSVDTFFLVGGMVNCYAFLKATHGRRAYNWLMFYVHRYLRLTPAFALMVGITATWLNLLSSGPLWINVAGSAADGCRDYWWSTLLYVANYVNPGDQCMMQSWYLMVDMQMHWLSPLILVPLWKWGRVGLGWLGTVILVSCAVPFALTYVNEFRTPISTDIRPEAQHFFMKHMYYPTHTRFTSYVCGTLAGYVLYLVKTNQLKWKLSHTQVVIGWLLSVGLCLTVVFGVQPLMDTEHHPYNVVESSFYMGFYRLAWSAGLFWVILACIMGHGGPVNAFLSWAPFNVLGRLTYGIYLTHAAVQIVDVGTMRSSEYYSDYRMVERMLSDAVLATIFGACLCLTTESPISALEKTLLKSEPRNRRSREAVTSANGGGQQGVDNTAFVPDSEKGQRGPSLPNSSMHEPGSDPSASKLSVGPAGLPGRTEPFVSQA